MKSETEIWLNYADDNLLSAQILLESHLYNPSLQNTQQSIEKFLKALFVEKGFKLQKTHSIAVLAETPRINGLELSINDDEIDLIDSIYLTSKYPFGSVLADFEPDTQICRQCLEIAKTVKKGVLRYLS